MPATITSVTFESESGTLDDTDNSSTPATLKGEGLEAGQQIDAWITDFPDTQPLWDGLLQYSVEKGFTVNLICANDTPNPKRQEGVQISFSVDGIDQAYQLDGINVQPTSR